MEPLAVGMRTGSPLRASPLQEPRAGAYVLVWATPNGGPSPGTRDRPPAAERRDSLTFLALDHVQLAMPPGGEEPARGFYGGVLGLGEIPKPETMRAGGGVWFRSGGVELHLGPEGNFSPARKAHPGLRVDQIDLLAERCEAAGFPVEWDARYPGVRRFYVHDPFGNRIEVLQPERGATPEEGD